MKDFRAAREKLFQDHMAGRCGLEFAAAYTDLMDSHIRELFEQAVGRNRKSEKIALIALGGYGRRELAPYSDIDLLFLIPSSAGAARQLKEPVESLLYPLWDLKMDVGHAVRSLAECAEVSRQDFATLVSCLDARFLAGDEKLFAEFERELRRWLGGKARKREFFVQLKETLIERHRKFGKTPYLLEPNVKEGQGGLRDIHTIIWAGNALFNIDDLEQMVGRGYLPADRVEELKADRGFMTCVRSHLHRLAGERNDTLSFEHQESLAEIFDFKADGEVSRVERFMQEYYTRVYHTKGALDYFLSRVDEELRPAHVRRMTQRARTVEKGLVVRRGLLELAGRTELRNRPILMMRAFEAAAAEGLRIKEDSLELIRSNLELVDDAYRRDPAVAKSFLKGLVAVPPSNVSAPKKLEAVQDLDFLVAYIPELAGVRARVQHDAYHVYTVDVHLILTFWELKKIAAGLADEGVNGVEKSVFDQVTDRELLFLAALLHDVGKGQGRDHARRGAEIVPAIGERLGLEPERVETLAFLVAEHLYLIEIATRRDLNEEKLILTCAERVGNPQRLHMLYLITVADSRATGPGAWNHWKAGLLRELYFKVLGVLTRSKLADWEISKRTERLRTEVTEMLAGEMTPAEIGVYFENMSAHYLWVADSGQIARHLLLERQVNEQNPLIWEVETRPEGYCEVLIITPDRPGLLSRMAGVFSLHNINILGAQVFTRENNIALDVFQVEQPPDLLFADETWEKVRRDTLRALTGHLALDYRLAHKSPMLNTRSSAPRKPSTVSVDNKTSDFYTIVEVFTHDRLGLLYDLTKTLFDLQLSIYVAKISTKVDQVVDVFYVRDFFGQKLNDEDQIKELKAALTFTISD